MNQNPVDIIGIVVGFPFRLAFRIQATERKNKGIAPTYIEPNMIGSTPYCSPRAKNQLLAWVYRSCISRSNESWEGTNAANIGGFLGFARCWVYVRRRTHETIAVDRSALPRSQYGGFGSATDSRRLKVRLSWFNLSISLANPR
jgi:hypothetical protein